MTLTYIVYKVEYDFCPQWNNFVANAEKMLYSFIMLITMWTQRRCANPILEKAYDANIRHCSERSIGKL